MIAASNTGFVALLLEFPAACGLAGKLLNKLK
jgi:hypothetical protein